MDRKEFLKRILHAGFCCCGAVMGLGNGLHNKRKLLPSQESTPAAQSWILELERRMIKGAETPGWKKAVKAQEWIKDLVDHMDEVFDQETRIKLLQACGRSCFIRAFGTAPEDKPSPEKAEEYLRLLQNRGYKVRQEATTTTIIFNWGRTHQNPWGLRIQDGYCMCPIFESGSENVSGTYCNCSTGYVKESFERAIGKPLKVEILDSLKLGGKDCIFKIEIQNT